MISAFSIASSHLETPWLYMTIVLNTDIPLYWRTNGLSDYVWMVPNKDSLNKLKIVGRTMKYVIKKEVYDTE